MIQHHRNFQFTFRRHFSQPAYCSTGSTAAQEENQGVGDYETFVKFVTDGIQNPEPGAAYDSLSQAQASLYELKHDGKSLVVFEIAIGN